MKLFFFKERFAFSEKKLSALTELKNNPVATRTRIKRVEKTLADDFTLLAPCRDKIKVYEEIIHYIRSGAETPIIERP